MQYFQSCDAQYIHIEDVFFSVFREQRDSANMRGSMAATSGGIGSKGIRTMAGANRSLICLVAGLFTIGVSNAAYANECFPGPDFQPPPGTRWQYQTDPAKNEPCWYVEKLGSPSKRQREIARSSRSVRASSASEKATIMDAPRTEQREATPTADPSPSIITWFWSAFSNLTDSVSSYSPAETDQDTSSSATPTPKRRQNDSMATRKGVAGKSEQPSKVAQRKPVREKRESEGVQQRYSISAVAVLEAAGDKPVPGVSKLVRPDLQKTMEVVGDKDVAAAPAEPQEGWQRALYEEFLQWRVKQVMP
jgi:hypothetical protein